MLKYFVSSACGIFIWKLLETFGLFLLIILLIPNIIVELLFSGALTLIHNSIFVIVEEVEKYIEGSQQNRRKKQEYAGRQRYSVQCSIMMFIKNQTDTQGIINRPGVDGAVLQIPLSMINWENVQLHQVSHVMCHMSHVTCHVLYVTCNM